MLQNYLQDFKLLTKNYPYNDNAHSMNFEPPETFYDH